MPKLASREFWFLLLFFITALLAAFLSVSLLQDKVIGAIDHPGLQGEILFQKNIIYNFEKGNLFNHFKTDYLNYPFGENLGFAFANSLHLFMYIPLKFFLGIIEAYNILVIIIFLLNFLSAYFLTKYLFSSKPVAFCSALVFALNPYVLLKMNQGFINKIAMFWIPLYCLALFRLQNTKSWRYAFEAGFILCLMQLTYPPYAFYVLVFTIVLSFYSLLKRDQLLFVFTRFICILTLYLFLTSLVYYVMGFGLIYLQMYEPIFHITTDGCLDLFRPFLFFPYHSPWYPEHLPLGISFICFLCSAIVLIKKRGLPQLLFLNFLVFTLIAAGPYLIHNGKIIHILGREVTLPFYSLAKYVPFAGGIFFPIRVFPFINICLALLTGYSLQYFSSVIKKLKPLVIAIIFSVIYFLENLILFPQLFPVQISDVNIPKFYREIKNKDFEAILNLPVSSDRKKINRYGYYAALSEKKMMNPYNKDELQIYLPKNVDDRQVKKEFIDLLSSWNVGYVIVHGDFLAKDNEGKSVDEFSWLKTLCESTIYPEDNLLVYKIPKKE